jgi:hypothetical protein
MGGISNADNKGTEQTATESKPDCGQNDRQIVKTLENIMKIVQIQWCQVMEQTACNNKESQQ